MKLNVVAGSGECSHEEGRAKGSRSRFGEIVKASVAAFALCALSAGSAVALDGIDLDQAPEATPAGECPELIKIKYPFLHCTNGQIGSADGNATWENSRRIRPQSEWIEGDGAWGWERDRD